MWSTAMPSYSQVVDSHPGVGTASRNILHADSPHTFCQDTDLQN